MTTPKIIATGTEGGTQLFTVDYFDKLAYLAQSPQFYKQMLVGSGYERVFEIGHVMSTAQRSTIHPDTSMNTSVLTTKWDLSKMRMM